jgi:hypothetical protein
MRKALEIYLMGFGFLPSTLALLNDGNIAKLAAEYRFKK